MTSATTRRGILLLAAGLLAAPAVAEASGKKKEGGEKKAGEGSSYIQVPPLTATIIRPSGRRGVMTVEAGLDVPNPKLHTYADQVLPRLRAAFVQQAQIYAAGLSAGALPNADLLAKELQRETDRVLGKPGAKLLIGTILVN